VLSKKAINAEGALLEKVLSKLNKKRGRKTSKSVSDENTPSETRITAKTCTLVVKSSFHSVLKY
jgi:hypothetical protein